MPVPQRRAGALSCANQPTGLYFPPDNFRRLAGRCAQMTESADAALAVAGRPFELLLALRRTAFPG